MCLSSDGTVYSFGDNYFGHLGIGIEKTIPVPMLPKIRQVSCGNYFTICLDYEGFIWSFGDNNAGQLVTGDLIKQITPKKIQNIPTIQSIYCGAAHTLIITENFDLYSCGWNTDNYALNTTRKINVLQKKLLSQILQ